MNANSFIRVQKNNFFGIEFGKMYVVSQVQVSQSFGAGQKNAFRLQLTGSTAHPVTDQLGWFGKQCCCS